MRSEIKVLPEDFLERLQKILPAGKFDSIANTFSEEKPTTFRINLLKADSVEAVREKLKQQGFEVGSVPWYSQALILQNNRLRELQETSVYKDGEIYVQSLSSMIPPLVLDPKPGETILDLAAAPGSKTTQIAAMMKGNGRLVAVDNNRIRFFKLKANLDMQGAKNVEAMLCYGESIGRKYPDFFDKVLLDAPCSSEGRFNAREPATYKYWKLRKVEEMQRKQKKLFYSAFSALKPGGLMVYSTCTFAPEENEAILDWAMEKFGGAIDIETIRELSSQSITNQMAGLASWEGKLFHAAVRKSVRIIPNAQMEGFFVARIRKTRTTLHEL